MWICMDMHSLREKAARFQECENFSACVSFRIGGVQQRDGGSGKSSPSEFLLPLLRLLAPGPALPSPVPLVYIHVSALIAAHSGTRRQYVLAR